MEALTLKLDEHWDISLTGSGNLQTASESYAIAQTAANAVKLFRNDAFFDWERGIPHFDVELKPRPSLAVLRNRIHEAAMTVDGVESAYVTLDEINRDTRELTGEIQIVTKYSDTLRISF